MDTDGTCSGSCAALAESKTPCDFIKAFAERLFSHRFIINIKKPLSAARLLSAGPEEVAWLGEGEPDQGNEES